VAKSRSIRKSPSPLENKSLQRTTRSQRPIAAHPVADPHGISQIAGSKAEKAGGMSLSAGRTMAAPIRAVAHPVRDGTDDEKLCLLHMHEYFLIIFDAAFLQRK